MLNSDFQFVYLSYYSSLITSHFFATPVIDFSKNNGGDDPSDPSGTHDKPKYVDYRMVDLRPYDTSGQFQIEMGVYAVTRECAKTLISDYLNESDNYPSYPLTDPEGDKRPIQIKSKETAYMYCNTLSEYWGLTPYYTEVYDGTPVTDSPDDDAFYGVRLPTNAEWVFAANAGLNNSLYSGPKWTENDVEDNLMYSVGDSPYGDKSSDKLLGRWKFMYSLLPDSTATEIDGIKYWDDIPDNPNTIGTHIDGYTEDKDNYATSTANFSMYDLNNYAWTRYNLYNNSSKSDIEDMPHVLPEFVYNNYKKDDIVNDHNWLRDGENPTVVFGYKGKLYKTNVRGWHNRVGDTAGNSNSFGTHAVGKLNPNAFGLYDMTGNVAELVKEGYYKGGSFATNQRDITNSKNITSDKVCGFRVCRNIKTI